MTTDPDKTRFVCSSRTSTGMNPVCGRQHGGTTCPAGDSLCKSTEADRLPLRFRRAGVERESFLRLKWWRQISCIDTRHPLPCIVGFHPPPPPVVRCHQIYQPIARPAFTPRVALCVFVAELNVDFNPSDHPRASTIFLSKSQNHGELFA